MRPRWPSLFPMMAVLGVVARFAAADPAADAPAAVAHPPFPDARVRAWQTGVPRPDRLQHASFAYTAGLMMGLTSKEPAAAFGSAMVLGLAKELWDVRRSGFDWLDITADAIGASAAAATTVTLSR